jgi:hypothetical protein
MIPYNPAGVYQGAIRHDEYFKAISDEGRKPSFIA